MMFLELSAETVLDIHDWVLNPNELTGLAMDKSLEGTLGRVENRLAYGLIEDGFHLAACYAEAISQGHCFNDGNKRTAYQSMIVCLTLNGLKVDVGVEDVGDRIILLAQGKLPVESLATWLRQQAKAQ